MTEAERLANALTESWGIREEGRRQWRLVPCDDADAAAALLRSQAAEIEALRKDAERLEWMEHWLFEKRWNGVIGAGSQTDWTMAGNWRHITFKMRGHTFRAAIDAARKA